MTTCGDFERLLNAWLDVRGTLSPDLQSSLESHSAECPSCRALQARYSVLIQAIHAIPPAPPLSTDFSTRVLQALEPQPVARGFRLFTRGRIGSLAIAAGLLVAIGLTARQGAPGRKATESRSEVVQSDEPNPADLSEAFAAATDATWKLANDTSAPAARLGWDILETTRLPGTSVSFSMSDRVDTGAGAVVEAPGDLLQGLGERVNAGIAPLSGTARQAFGFLLGPSSDPAKPVSSERRDHGA